MRQFFILCGLKLIMTPKRSKVLFEVSYFSRPLHKTRKWQLCQKLACYNLGDKSFTA